MSPRDWNRFDPDTFARALQPAFDGLAESLGGRIDGLGGKIDQLGDRIGRVEHRLEILPEATASAMAVHLVALRTELRRDLAGVVASQDSAEIRMRLERLEERVDDLEKKD